MRDLGLLILRLATGALLAGHGAQKLFGAFGGPGLEGTGQMLEGMGVRPGRVWAPVAALSEFGGGVLTALGLLDPLGPIGIIGAMGAATATAHRGRPIWASEGGAELPVTNMAVAAAVALTGPGRYSLDSALGVRVPAPVALLALGACLAGVALVAVRPDALARLGSERATEPPESTEDRLRRAVRV